MRQELISPIQVAQGDSQATQVTGLVEVVVEAAVLSVILILTEALVTVVAGCWSCYPQH